MQTFTYIVSTNDQPTFKRLCTEFETWAKKEETEYQFQFSTAGFVLMQEVPGMLAKADGSMPVQQVPLIVFSMCYFYVSEREFMPGAKSPVIPINRN